MSTSTLESIRKGEFTLNTSDNTPKFIGLLILLITFGLFGTWSFVAPLDSAALAPGQVTVKSYRKTVQHLEGGIVKELRVRDGDRVEKNQTLMVLDDTQLKAELEIVRGQIIALEATKARLQAERDNSESVNFPQLLRTGDPRANEAKQNETAVFEARTNAIAGEVSVLEQRLSQFDEQVNGLKQIIASRNTLISSYSEETSELQDLLKDGYVDIQRVRELERQTAELKGQIADYRSSIAQAEVSRGETQLQILQIEKNFSTEVVDQLTQVEANLFDLRERERATLARLNRTTIRAPESGMVLGLQLHTEGGVVQPGAQILDIVPESSELLIEAEVSPIDIDRVQTGLVADVRFSAFKQATTPVIEGVVTQISADRLVNQETGMPYYLARVEIPEDQLARLGSLMLVPGMPAEVLINTGERTFFEYLVQPATNAFARSLIED